MADVKLSPERYALLIENVLDYDAIQLGKGEDLIVVEPIEIEGVAFLPAVYRPA